jgi:hypothetical protein
MAPAPRVATAQPIDGDLVVLQRIVQAAARAGAAGLNRREIDLRRIDVVVLRRINIVNSARMIVRVELGQLLHERQRFRQLVVLVVLLAQVEEQARQITEARDHLAIVAHVIVAFPCAVVFQHQIQHDSALLHVLLHVLE